MADEELIVPHEFTADEQQQIVNAANVRIVSSNGTTASYTWPPSDATSSAQPVTDDRLIAFGGAIKSIGVDRVGGYLIRWGDRVEKDLQGEYFTKDTNLELDWYKTIPLLYHHGLDKTIQTTKMGDIDTFKTDDIGLWVEAQLDMRDRYVRAVRGLIERGALQFSSRAPSDLVITEPDGFIKRWPVIEGSSTPTPAEPRDATRLISIKSLAELPTPDLAIEPSVKGLDAEEVAASQNVTVPDTSSTKDGNIMDQEMLAAIVNAVAQQLGATITPEQMPAIMAAAQEACKGTDYAVAEGSTPEQAQAVSMKAVQDADFLVTLAGAIGKAIKSAKVESQVAVADAVKAAMKNAPAISQIPSGAVATQQRVTVTRATKYSNMSAEDMAYYHTFVRGMRRAGANVNVPEDAFYREIADKVDNKQMIKLPTKSADIVRRIKSNELDTSTQSSYGDEWVPDLWLNNLWELIRLENVVASQFDIVNMPSNPYELPIESTDPTVYKVPETADEASLTLASSSSVIPDSKLGTGKVTLTADKLALRVGISNETDEDSIIAFIPQARKQAMRTLLDAVDNVFLNADNTASGNINYAGGTPGGTEKYYVGFKGIIYNALVANSAANALDMGGIPPTLANIRATRKLMASRYAADVRNLVSFCDFSTYVKLLSLPEFLTVDKYGPNATILTGEIGKIDGVPVLMTNEMALAYTAGKVSSTSNQNTLGRFVYAHKNAYHAGYRRQPTINVEFLSYYDAYVMTATVRPAFVARDATCSSILYNIAV